MPTPVPTIPELAAQARSCFQYRYHDQDYPDSGYWYFVYAVTPHWVRELVFQAHRQGDGDGDPDLLPDDFRYAFIVEALESLARATPETQHDQRLAPDTDPHRLTAWLYSHESRLAFCDTARACSAPHSSMLRLLQFGQALEKNDVLNSVRQSLCAEQLARSLK